MSWTMPYCYDELRNRMWYNPEFLVFKPEDANAKDLQRDLYREIAMFFYLRTFVYDVTDFEYPVKEVIKHPELIMEFGFTNKEGYIWIPKNRFAKREYLSWTIIDKLEKLAQMFGYTIVS